MIFIICTIYIFIILITIALERSNRIQSTIIKCCDSMDRFPISDTPWVRECVPTTRPLHIEAYTHTPTILTHQIVPTTQAKFYATITMINSFTTKEQAILIDTIDDTTMKDYILAVSKVTGSEASRISNGRICIYLDRKTTAQLTTEQ